MGKNVQEIIPGAGGSRSWPFSVSILPELRCRFRKSDRRPGWPTGSYAVKNEVNRTVFQKISPEQNEWTVAIHAWWIIYHDDSRITCLCRHPLPWRKITDVTKTRWLTKEKETLRWTEELRQRFKYAQEHGSANKLYLGSHKFFILHRQLNYIWSRYYRYYSVNRTARYCSTSLIFRRVPDL